MATLSQNNRPDPTVHPYTPRQYSRSRVFARIGTSYCVPSTTQQVRSKRWWERARARTPSFVAGTPVASRKAIVLG